MATGTITLEKATQGLPELLAVSPHIWVDYDESADVLYLSFRRPQQATDSVLEGHVVYHYDGEELVGATFIGFRAGWGSGDSQS
jgi:hypothetical protein